MQKVTPLDSYYLGILTPESRGEVFKSLVAESVSLQQNKQETHQDKMQREIEKAVTATDKPGSVKDRPASFY